MTIPGAKWSFHGFDTWKSYDSYWYCTCMDCNFSGWEAGYYGDFFKLNDPPKMAPRYDIQKEWELGCEAKNTIMNNMTQNEWEFYHNNAEGVRIFTVNGYLYHGRARAVQGGVVIFFPEVKIENIK